MQPPLLNIFNEFVVKYLPLIGRILFSIIFIIAGFTHFNPSVIGYAASQGVPMAEFLVPLSGIMAIVGALSILLGFKVRWGAALIVLFLVPITFTMHAFWTLSDPMMAQMQSAMFFKNLALVGGAILVGFLGTGPLSLDARLRWNLKMHM